MKFIVTMATGPTGVTGDVVTAAAVDILVSKWSAEIFPREDWAETHVALIQHQL